MCLIVRVFVIKKTDRVRGLTHFYIGLSSLWAVAVLEDDEKRTRLVNYYRCCDSEAIGFLITMAHRTYSYTATGNPWQITLAKGSTNRMSPQVSMHWYRSRKESMRFRMSFSNMAPTRPSVFVLALRLAAVSKHKPCWSASQLSFTRWHHEPT